MPEDRTVVLGGQLTPKWSSPEITLSRIVTLTASVGGPPAMLEYCRRLVPCVLVVNGEFMHAIDPDLFYAVADFGLSIRVLVELSESSLVEGEHLIGIGCAGYLSRAADLAMAQRALRAVLAGELWVSRKILSSVVRNILRQSRHHLTFRESEILGLVSEGLRNSQIAERLFISPQTVRWHLRSLYTKMGTHDRLRAVIRAPLQKTQADLDG
jgi:DNA-binding NarL/FixJ family response regulator